MTNSSNGSAVIASILCDWRQWAVGETRQAACPTIDVRIALLRAYRTGGASELVRVYRRLWQKDRDRYDFSVRELNSLGYQAMRM